MDKSQIEAVVHYMIGDYTVGSASDEELTRPHSPELKAFIRARLGEQTPPFGRYVLFPEHKTTKPFAAFLREIADFIDPIVGEGL
jgi:hypothetical protein